MSAKDPEDDLLEALRRRTSDPSAGPEPGDEESPAAGDFDLVRAAMGAAGDPEEGRDVTLGGYLLKHDRPPAFSGADGEPYTVGVEAEPETGAERGWVGYLVFLRWAATGAGIMEHLDSGDVASAATEEEAREAVLALSLYDVKAELDAAIERRRSAMEE